MHKQRGLDLEIWTVSAETGGKEEDVDLDVSGVDVVGSNEVQNE